MKEKNTTEKDKPCVKMWNSLKILPDLETFTEEKLMLSHDQRHQYNELSYDEWSRYP